MTARLARIVRHPLKAIGREELDAVTLSPGAVLPWDRAFAVAHERSRASDLDGPWAQKANYLRGVTGPALMAVTCHFDETARRLTLRHPDRPELTLRLDAPEDERALIAWLDPIWPAEAPRPTRLIHHAGRAQTDVPDAWVAVHGMASHRAVAQKLGRSDLSIHRWRGNLWIEGSAPWEEVDWIGREFRIGDAVLIGREPITRCKATMANPETGRRDADTLGALEEGWGHTDFGIYAEVIEGALIRTGDPVA